MQLSRSTCGEEVSEKLLKASEFEVKFLMLSLSIYWRADRQSNPSGCLAAHFAGRWQTIRHTNLCLLMTLKHETKLYAGPSDLCESISKIILFAVATHFRLPPPITALSGEDDRLELRAVQGRFCSIRHQRPSRPQSPPFINITSSFTFDSTWTAAYISCTQIPFDKTCRALSLLLCFIYDCANSTGEYTVACYKITLMDTLAMYN